jgi:hypothetical protein
MIAANYRFNQKTCLIFSTLTGMMLTDVSVLPLATFLCLAAGTAGGFVNILHNFL